MKQAAVVLATLVYNAAKADKRLRAKDRKALGELSDVKR